MIRTFHCSKSSELNSLQHMRIELNWNEDEDENWI